MKNTKKSWVCSYHSKIEPESWNWLISFFFFTARETHQDFFSMDDKCQHNIIIVEQKRRASIWWIRTKHTKNFFHNITYPTFPFFVLIFMTMSTWRDRGAQIWEILLYTIECSWKIRLCASFYRFNVLLRRAVFLFFHIFTSSQCWVSEKSTIPFFVHLVIRWKFINLHPATF